MKNRIIVFLILILISVHCFGQDDCEELPTGKKFEKMMNNARNKKKFNTRERDQFLKQALDVEPNCAECLLLLGQNAYRRAKLDGLSYTAAENYYKTLLEVCPDYHSDPYYALGIIYYGKEDFVTSASYFKAFLNYNVDDDSKYARDWDDKYEDVKNSLPEIEFYAEFFNNPVPFEPKVVANVSGEGDEYLPTISPDNHMLFYTRKYSKKAKGDLFANYVEEFTVSERETLESPFDGGKALENPFNMGKNTGGSSISVNNKELYVTMCQLGKGGYQNCDIYVTRYKLLYDSKTKKERYQWSALENLGPNINTDNGWESQPSISGDNRTLYFATIREETQQTDIYYSERDSVFQWGPAKPLDAINTVGNDKAPFVHSDSKTLYFSSDGRPGAGGYDIYYTRCDSNVWREPKNIGYPINSTNDEHGLIVSTDGKLAYFASGSYAGARGLDILSFEIPPAAKPDAVMILKGSLKDTDGFIPDSASVELSYANSKKVDKIQVDEYDGTYAAAINITEHKEAVLTVKQEGYAFKSKVIEAVKENNSPIIDKIDFKIEKIEIGKPYRMDDVNFATNSANLTEETKAILNEFLLYLIDNPNTKIALHGHTDNVGEPSSNLELSKARTESVKAYLIEKGINSSRLTCVGYGESKPLSSNSNEKGRAINRRTEFVILSK